MIITRTPYRISFFGGGSDYHTWYQEHGGAVLSTTINYYCNLFCSFKPPFFEKKHRIVWREVEEVDDIFEIKHPVVREGLKYLDFNRGLELNHKGDLPGRSGLGSSSSFTVGFLNAMYALRGQMSTKQQLAAEAVHLERDIMKENVGVQDQIAAAYGGLNRIKINPDGTFFVEPLPLIPQRAKELNGSLMLFFTGISRTASNFAAQKMAAMPKKSVEISEIQAMVDIAANILTNGSDLKDFGKLLHETWLLKRSLTSGISSDFIDDIYYRATQAGATGGKLLGAGGGGFICFFVEPEKQPMVLEALSDLMWIPFEFEKMGSHVSFFSPTSFSRESLMRRDFAHLKDQKNFKSVQKYVSGIKAPKTMEERKTKFNII